MIILNGVPRSGKSSIAVEIVATAPGDWVNIGVDSVMAATPEDRLPGLGLRPGGERPDLEPFVLEQYRQLFAQVAESARAGTNVVVDVGVHDGYSRPLDIAGEIHRALAGLSVLIVGVHCSLDALRIRREQTGYLTWPESSPPPPAVLRWRDAIHTSLRYDFEVDTSTTAPAACAALILA